MQSAASSNLIINAVHNWRSLPREARALYTRSRKGRDLTNPGDHHTKDRLITCIAGCGYGTGLLLRIILWKYSVQIWKDTIFTATPNSTDRNNGGALFTVARRYLQLNVVMLAGCSIDIKSSSSVLS